MTRTVTAVAARDAALIDQSDSAIGYQLELRRAAGLREYGHRHRPLGHPSAPENQAGNRAPLQDGQFCGGRVQLEVYFTSEPQALGVIGLIIRSLPGNSGSGAWRSPRPV